MKSTSSLLPPIDHPDPAVSVIVPTIPENDHDAVVTALEQQTTDSFDVLVVNDPDLGVCEARNLGLERAEGDIVAFTDDDCRPPAGWVEAIDQAFAEREDLVVLEGPVEGGMTYEGRRKYPTCNLAADRETALEAGGFDDRFEYWREDTEFGWRLEEYGTVVYDKRVRMMHPDRPRSSIVQENEELLRRLYPDKYEAVIVPDTFAGRVNDWLWRKGVWDTVDAVRYGKGWASVADVLVLHQFHEPHHAHRVFGDAVDADYRHFETGNEIGGPENLDSTQCSPDCERPSTSRATTS